MPIEMTNQRLHKQNRLLTLRRATEDDSQDIWHWRNDSLTKAMSVNSDDVSWETHHAWYSKALIDTRRMLIVAELSPDEKVGVCRFDLIDEGAEVSINLNPTYRNLGLSRQVLEGAIREFRLLHQPTLLAKIKINNVASLKLFTGCGFAINWNDGEYCYCSRANTPSSAPPSQQIL